MKELIVISGKGGTGKTSITASLAVLAEKSVIADCDVDAADLHLVLSPIVNTTKVFISGHEAKIDKEKCVGCGVCEEYCRFDAIIKDDKKFIVDPISCEGCKLCVQFCPENAISFPDSLCGEWYSSTTKYGPMIHANLKAGTENSGKLVSLVRKEARAKAEAENIDLIIVDGPPGTGCPVISAITGASAVLIITEPTISGYHDMERVHSVSKHFKIPALIAVNKWDINPEIFEKIELFAKDYNIPLVGKISYSPLFSEAQVNGKSIAEYKREDSLVIEISELWNNINRNIFNNKKEKK